MISKEQYKIYRKKTLEILENAKIALTPKEKENVEIADFGLGNLEKIGLQVVTYVNTQRCCAKELVLMPYQICPEHRHPAIGGKPGKEETFRCRKGEVELYVGGYLDSTYKDNIPEGLDGDLLKYLTVFHKIVLQPGDQYTLPENTLHWFRAGKEGCIVSEFSTRSIDELDIFTDPRIKRIPEIDGGEK